MHLGETLTHFQRPEGVSDYRLALLTGIDRGTICNLKKGDVRPTTYTLERIARALNIKHSDIILHAESLELNKRG
jgi:transcriptional regulator with XRE-family HTH domain